MGVVPNAAESGEVFFFLILRSDYLKWIKELRGEKIASPNSKKWFTVLILKIYYRESLSLTESLYRRIRSRIRMNQELKLELCQMRPYWSSSICMLVTVSKCA
jgi:hypothetical protein